MKPLALIEAQVYPTGWRQLARLALAGAVIATPGRLERISRRDGRRVVTHLARRWFQWTTALPGDRFWVMSRDLHIEVRGGLPGHRLGVLVSGEFAYRYGLRAAATQPPQPIRFTWKEVQRRD